MKTRIISAAVMISIVLAALIVGKLWAPIVITVMIALICAGAVYELLHNVANIRPLAISIISSVYGAIMVFLLDNHLSFDGVWHRAPLFLTIIYVIFAVCIILYYHKNFLLDKIATFVAFPIFIVYGFAILNGIISDKNGIYYLLLLVNFASICDTGAYFVGSFFGKKKLCPNISPKKTVEGAIGGIVSSLVVSLILVLSFDSAHILTTLLLTVPLCIVGMLGDLFASAIKRSVGLKDYSNLIPGHGGLLDRFDSMLLIAPVLYMFIEFGVI